MITAFIQQMHRLILQHAMIEKGEIVLVAVSGGADSLALLYGLHALRSQLDCLLHVAHLNHRLRSDADIDADFVLHHASLLDLPCTVRCSEVPCLVKEWKLSTEAAGRRARYQFYEAVCREVGATKIALGHHRDDIAETVLMNLIRGSGATGLKGIAPIRDVKIIRPLVGFTREHIETFLTAISVKPLYDSTNTDKRYLRNRIRHELIPLLETSYNPNIKAGLRRTAEVLSAESEYLKIVTQTAFETCRISDTAKTSMPDSIILDRARFRGYHMALQRRMLRQSIFEMLGDLSDLYFVHAEAMLNLIESDTPHAVLALPNGLEFRRVYQQLIFEIRATSGSKPAIGAGSFSYPICVPGNTFVPVLKAELAAEVGEVSSYETLVIPNGKFEAIFDYEKLRSVFADTCSFTVRNRRQGDRFQPYGMRGTKKIKDFLIDVKVPRHERDRIPLLVCGDTILWLIGYTSSELFKLKPSTRQYLYLRYVSVQPLS